MVLIPNHAKIEAYNKLREKLALEHPDMASYFKPIQSIDELFCPYSKWEANMTDKDRVELKIVHDTAHDFTGVYVCGLNEENTIARVTDYDTNRFDYEYGVCDNASQILDNFDIADDSVVLMTPIFKEHQPDHGGWRWHKWGHYYGVQNPQCEYLFDEPDIEMVYVFHIHTLTPAE